MPSVTCLMILSAQSCLSLGVRGSGRGRSLKLRARLLQITIHSASAPTARQGRLAAIPVCGLDECTSQPHFLQEGAADLQTLRGKDAGIVKLNEQSPGTANSLSLKTFCPQQPNLRTVLLHAGKAPSCQGSLFDPTIPGSFHSKFKLYDFCKDT